MIDKIETGAGKKGSRGTSRWKLPAIDWDYVMERLGKVYRSHGDDYSVTQHELLYVLSKEHLRVTRSKINEWHDAGIISSRREAGSHPLYGRAEIMKAFFAAILHIEYGLPQSQIGVAASLYAAELLQHDGSAGLSMKDLNQEARARLILTSRILSVCAAWVLDERRAPSDTIIVCRLRDAIAQPAPKPTAFCISKVGPQEVREAINPETSISGWTLPGSFDEVFPVMDVTEPLKRRMGRDVYEFYRFDITPERESLVPVSIYIGPRTRSDTAAILEGMVGSEITPSANHETFELASALIQFALAGFSSPKARVKTQIRRSWNEDSSMLDILVSSCLLHEPEDWVSGTFYALQADQIVERVAEAGYPSEGRVLPATASVSDAPGPIQWVLRRQTHMVINYPEPHDFRLPTQPNASRYRHAFIPAMQEAECIGVLHIVASPRGPGSKPAFTRFDVSFLYVLARIVGEAYLRARVAGAEGLTRALPLAHEAVGDETELLGYLSKVLREDVEPLLSAGANEPSRSPIMTQVLGDRYLSLFAIDCRVPLSGGAADEYGSLMRERISDYLQHGELSRSLVPSGPGPVFHLGEMQFVVPIRNLREGQVREVREGMQLSIDEISEINPAASAQSVVWSVHLSYHYLLESLQPTEAGSASKVDRAAQEAVDRVREALRIVWQVKLADEALQRGMFDEALTLLQEAQTLDPSNSYVYRHIAQAWLGKGEYSKAKAAAEQAIKIDEDKGRPFASNHLRLAESLFLLDPNERASAFKEMETACAISHDVKYRLRWAEMLILDGTETNVMNALRMLIDIRMQVERDDNMMAWVEKLRSEASLRLGDYDQALSALRRAAQVAPGENSLNWDIARVQTYISNGLGTKPA